MKFFALFVLFATIAAAFAQLDAVTGLAKPVTDLLGGATGGS